MLQSVKYRMFNLITWVEYVADQRAGLLRLAVPEGPFFQGWSPTRVPPECPRVLIQYSLGIGPGVELIAFGGAFQEARWL